MQTPPSDQASYSPQEHEFPIPKETFEGLAFGTRVIKLFAEPQTQYLVFAKGFDAISDPRCNHVIGSGFKFAHACISANNYLVLNAVKPADFWPRLEGCTFTKEVESGNAALQHVCRDDQGRELSRADGREESAKLALHRVLAGRKDLTMNEFAAISVPVQVTPGGRRTYGLVFNDEQGQSSLRRMLKNGVKNSTLLQASAKAELEKAGGIKDVTQAKGRVFRDAAPFTSEQKSQNAMFEAFVASVQKTVLSAKFNADVFTHALKSSDGQWVANVIVHASHVSKSDALLLAYANEGHMVNEEDADAAPEHDQPAMG